MVFSCTVQRTTTDLLLSVNNVEIAGSTSKLKGERGSIQSGYSDAHSEFGMAM